MPVRPLKQFLDSHGVQYTTIDHPLAFTAKETASSARLAGNELAKTVMVKVDGVMAMAVLPSSSTIDFEKLKEVCRAEHVSLATEQEFRDRFPDCELGAMPPFGNLYGMNVLVARDLADDREIAFSAGNHRELIRMSYRDFEQLVQPKILKFSAI